MSKGILVNTGKQSLSYIEIDDYKQIYDHIGNGCGIFCIPVEFENRDALYADDEGLYHDFQGGLLMKDWIVPIVGNIVILGCDEEGETIDAKTTIEEIAPQIKFVTKQEIFNGEWKAKMF